MSSFLSLSVADVMSTDLVTASSTMTLADLRALFEEHDYNGLPVVDDGQFVGWVTQFDLLGAFVFTTKSMVPPYDEILARRVDTIIVPEPETVPPDRPLSRVLQQMIATRRRSFPVLDAESTLLGVVARRDILTGLRADIEGG